MYTHVSGYTYCFCIWDITILGKVRRKGQDLIIEGLQNHSWKYVNGVSHHVTNGMFNLSSLWHLSPGKAGNFAILSKKKSAESVNAAAEGGKQEPSARVCTISQVKGEKKKKVPPVPFPIHSCPTSRLMRTDNNKTLWQIPKTKKISSCLLYKSVLAGDTLKKSRTPPRDQKRKKELNKKLERNNLQCGTRF